MKSAEEWLMEPTNTPNITQEKIRAIQLDAMKEGMWRAAKMAAIELPDRYSQPCVEDAVKAILTAANQLTEKDLQ